MQKVIVVLSLIVSAIAFLSVRTSTATIGRLAANIYTILGAFKFFAWVGLYCLVAALAVNMGHLWILDFLGGRGGQMCGNKFLHCRPWD